MLLRGGAHAPCHEGRQCPLEFCKSGFAIGQFEDPFRLDFKHGTGCFSTHGCRAWFTVEKRHFAERLPRPNFSNTVVRGRAVALAVNAEGAFENDVEPVACLTLDDNVLMRRDRHPARGRPYRIGDPLRHELRHPMKDRFKIFRFLDLFFNGDGSRAHGVTLPRGPEPAAAEIQKHDDRHQQDVIASIEAKTPEPRALHRDHR